MRSFKAEMVVGIDPEIRFAETSSTDNDVSAEYDGGMVSVMLLLATDNELPKERAKHASAQ